MRVGQRILSLEGVILGDKERGKSFEDVLAKKEAEGDKKDAYEIVAMNLLSGDTLMGCLVLQGIGEGVDKLPAVKYDGDTGELVPVEVDDEKNNHADNPTLSRSLFEYALHNRNIPFLKAMTNVLGSRAIPAVCYLKSGQMSGTTVA